MTTQTLMGAAKQRPAAGKTAKPRLTRTAYEARKAELSVHLDSAWVAYRAAALKVETGEADEAERTAARATVGTIEDSLVGLDAAWEEAQRQVQAEAKTADAVARKATLAALRDAFTKRQQALAEIETIVSAIGPHVEAFRAGAAEARQAMQPYFSEIGRDASENFRDSLKTQDVEVPIIESLLAAQGLNFRQSTGFQKNYPGSPGEIVLRHNMDAYGIALTILPDEDA